MADEFTRAGLAAQYPINRPIFYGADIAPFTGVSGQQVNATIQAKERTIFLATGLSVIQCRNPLDGNAQQTFDGADFVALLRLSNVSKGSVYDLSNNGTPTLASAFGGILNVSYTWPGYIMLEGLQQLRCDLTNFFVGSVAYSFTFEGVEYSQ